VASIAANSYSETLNDLFNTARTDFSTKFVESWSTTPSVYRDLYKRASKKTENPTGRRYEWPVELGTPSGVQRRAFDTAPALAGQTPNILVTASEDIATYEYLMEMTDDRMKLVKSPQVLVNTVEALTKNFGKKMLDDINRDFLATSTATNGVVSVIAVLPATPTSGTIHNLSRTTYSNWQSGTTTTGGAFSAVGYNQMRARYLAQSRGQGDDEPDLILSDDEIFNAWWQLNDSRDNFWLDESEDGKTTRRAMKFLNAKWVWDHNYPNATTLRMINSSHIEMKVIGETGKDEDKMGVSFGEWIHAVNASKSACIVKWQGQACWKAFRYSGQISGLTA